MSLVWKAFFFMELLMLICRCTGSIPVIATSGPGRQCFIIHVRGWAGIGYFILGKTLQLYLSSFKKSERKVE